MVYTHTWNAAFEANPEDTDDISDGASEIRARLIAVRERMAKDHYFPIDGVNDDMGEHLLITFHAQSAPGTPAENKAYLYTKDVSDKAELHFKDEDGNEVQITTAGEVSARDIPSGEIILFESDTAVAGYTLKTDYDDMSVFITKGSVAGGKYGGVSWYGVNRCTGNATGTSSYKLVDTSANFTAAGVVAGDVVINTTDSVAAMVTNVDNYYTLSIDKDIFTSGEAYQVKVKGYWLITGLGTAASADHTHGPGTLATDTKLTGGPYKLVIDSGTTGNTGNQPQHLHSVTTGVTGASGAHYHLGTGDGVWRPAARTFTRQQRN